MGTRSLTAFYDKERPLAVLYRQLDGYPTGHGADLRQLMQGAVMTNGIRLGETRHTFNGPGDLAVRVIAGLKAAQPGPGGFYLVSPFDALDDDGWEEYRYHVIPGSEGNGINLRVDSGYGSEWTTIYDGPIDDFDPGTVEASEDD